MLRQWSKQHVIVVGLDTLRWYRPDNSLQEWPVKTSGKQLLPDLLDLSMQLEAIADQLHGQSVTVHISHPLTRYQLLSRQKGVVKRQDWLALATQRFNDVFGPVAQQWQYQIHFQGYGQPVMAMAIDDGLLSLIDDQAKKSNWRLRGVFPELLALANCYRRKIKADDWLLLCYSKNYALLAERQNKCWQAIHVFTAEPMSLSNNVEAMLKQRQQSYETLKEFKVWTDATDNLPPNLAGLDLKPLSSRPLTLTNNALTVNP